MTRLPPAKQKGPLSIVTIVTWAKVTIDRALAGDGLRTGADQLAALFVTADHARMRHALSDSSSANRHLPSAMNRSILEHGPKIWLWISV